MEVVDFNDSYQAKATSDPDCNRVAVVLCTQDYLHVANGSCYQGNNLYTLWVKVCEGGGGPTDFPIEAPDNIGNAGNTFGGNSNSLPTSPLDDVNSKADLLLEVSAKLGVDITLLNNLSESTLILLNEIARLKENLSMVINAPNFDALNDSWLSQLRFFAKSIYSLKSIIPKKIFDSLIVQLDYNLKVTLTKTALGFNPNADDPKEGNKEYWFKNDGKKAVGILLYEFANGTGKDIRKFDESYDITQQMLVGNVLNDIKSDFNSVLTKEFLTFEQFSQRTSPLQGSYSFSPGHTSIADSFNKHINANWVQFFVGGTSITYYPSNDPDWIIVEMTNPTSRYSLLLHAGNSYKRDGLGNNRPLSTIKQVFRFKLKIK